MLSNKEIAIAFLNENLSENLLQSIDIQCIEYDNGSYITS